MSSKSQFYKNKNKLKNNLEKMFSIRSTYNHTENSESVYNLSSQDNSCDLNSSVNKTLNFRAKLKAWVQEHNPTVACCQSLFKILREENLDVPLSVSTLLSSKESCIIRTVSPGQYVHIGLLLQLNKVKHVFDINTEEISIDVGIDGLPLFKNSGNGLWPVLGKIVGMDQIDAFLIGTYIGPHKPLNIDSYLHDFLHEYKKLKEEGLNIGTKVIKFSIRAFICDTPARSFLCGVKGHMSFNGCTKCHQIGKRVNNVNTYSTKRASPRTDVEFAARLDQNFHKPFFLNFNSMLETSGIKMISQFPVEPMHMIDLGVTRKILKLIFQKRVGNLTTDQKLEMSGVLLSLSPYIPKEFVRKPREFQELNYWKSTEFRQFILYTGIVVLKSFVPNDLYNHFLLLHVSYRSLLSLHMFKQSQRTIDKWISKFVLNFPKYYGPSSVSFNVHSLLHLTECVKEFGDLSSISAYRFENFLKTLKQNVKMPRHIGKQIYKKFSDANIKIKTFNIGPKLNIYGDIIAFQMKSLYFTNSSPNNLCMTKSQTFIAISMFNKDHTFVGKSFLYPKNFFATPIKSLDINICVVNPNEVGPEKEYHMENILCKIVSVPFESKKIKSHKSDTCLSPQKNDCLKDILISIQLSDFNNKIVEEIVSLKEIIINQNNVLTNVLSNQITTLNSAFKSHFENPKFTTLFPLSSERDLNDFENMINDDNKSEIVSSIKRVLGNSTLQKGICRIFSTDIIINFNMRGIQGKQRLMNYKATMNVIFLAISSEVTTELEFLGIMRKAIKCAKNKHFKRICLKRKKDDSIASDSSSSK